MTKTKSIYLASGYVYVGSYFTALIDASFILFCFVFVMCACNVLGVLVSMCVRVLCMCAVHNHLSWKTSQWPGEQGADQSGTARAAAAVCMDTASHGTGQDVNHGCLWLGAGGGGVILLCAVCSKSWNWSGCGSWLSVIGGRWGGGSSCFVQFAAAVCMGTASHGGGGGFQGNVTVVCTWEIWGGGGAWLMQSMAAIRTQQIMQVIFVLVCNKLWGGEGWGKEVGWPAVFAAVHRLCL